MSQTGTLSFHGYVGTRVYEVVVFSDTALLPLPRKVSGDYRVVDGSGRNVPFSSGGSTPDGVSYALVSVGAEGSNRFSICDRSGRTSYRVIRVN